MLQRGRKSSSSLTVPVVDGTPSPLAAPTSLSKEERALFEELVATVDRRHFRASDAPLMAAYVRGILLEQRSVKELSADPSNTRALAVWEKATRALVSLSGRLQLCPQGRQHPRTAARLPPVGPRPWA